ncbi:MAG TPA: 23S rRNA (adenine(2503)-C(2))-methyltransferase RlmN [Solirubrobacteraceae bacterium]|jgi:23S rRNA (adenine2503-C2)-methyltransferase|nr:23S rRNA (adenine(2503)-C(2))-methyltransferase RlmN [Solirubrobacteraceae bacterium]
MDLALLDQTLAAAGQPRFRAKQVWEWISRGVESYEQMSNLPSALRDTLTEQVPLSCLSVQQEAHARDGTVKALFHTTDERPIEAVLMRYRDGRRSICLSSQSGCPLTCTFCATGAMRFGRNLTASEMLDQALHFRRTEAIDHCVFMGMGEPLINVENVLAACERLPDLGIGHRRITISTVGWIPGIERLAQQPMPLRLALSLHAADEALRTELMPVNERYPLSDVIEACQGFYARRHRRVFIEYVMLAGVNDRYEQALGLARLLRTALTAGGETIFKVNLIPWNPVDTRPPGDGQEPLARFRGSSRESIAAFKAVLVEHGVPATVRLTRGRDIDAACGQLAAKAG